MSTSIRQQSPGEIRKPSRLDNSIDLKDVVINTEKSNLGKLIRSISDECLRPESSSDGNPITDSLSMISSFDNRSDSLLGSDFLRPLKRRDTNNISLVPADFSISESYFKVNIESRNGSRLSSRRNSSIRKGSIRSSNTFTFETLPEYPTSQQNLDENIEVNKMLHYSLDRKYKEEKMNHSIRVLSLFLFIFRRLA